ncbi:hypothetical protein ABE607_16165 [Comamonas aquatica]|uniref:Uncharacterized protein n=1 Tax=Comamonas aquatica TaxID=225991 RepID=A0AA42L3L3_9BURK|nr:MULTISPECIES: hypothetical protein [Comamonas]MDH0364653.1 hypothetical protein [Comamonas aquatica]MDH0383225.1 hypothetical protein [Comamonas aquatica]MDH0431230.1 hypothetical protein [Comamonas aquatica]MDH0898985.1 hypothetical protein [Comamonas aquatica]MDH0942327.1 hypothetical protein [Comamonas aquatica]
MAKDKNLIATSGDHDKWQAEDDMRTLARAEEIRKDAKRFKAAVAMAKEKVKELEALQQLSANS